MFPCIEAWDIFIPVLSSLPSRCVCQPLVMRGSWSTFPRRRDNHTCPHCYQPCVWTGNNQCPNQNNNSCRLLGRAKRVPTQWTTLQFCLFVCMYIPYSTEITPTFIAFYKAATGGMGLISKTVVLPRTKLSPPVFASKLRPLMKKLSLFCLGLRPASSWNTMNSSIYTQKWGVGVISDVGVISVEYGMYVCYEPAHEICFWDSWSFTNFYMIIAQTLSKY